METCIVMPRELSVMLKPLPGKVLEMGVTLWANRALTPGTLFRADQGEVRLDKLEVYRLLQPKDMRYQFGCVDDIVNVDDRAVRHCNWVRFVQSTQDMGEVNMVATKVQGHPVFQIVKRVPPNAEIKVYFDPNCLTPKRDDVTTQEQLLLKTAVDDKENLHVTPHVTSGHAKAGSHRMYLYKKKSSPSRDTGSRSPRSPRDKMSLLPPPRVPGSTSTSTLESSRKSADDHVTSSRSVSSLPRSSPSPKDFLRPAHMSFSSTKSSLESPRRASDCSTPPSHGVVDQATLYPEILDFSSKSRISQCSTKEDSSSSSSPAVPAAPTTPKCRLLSKPPMAFSTPNNSSHQHLSGCTRLSDHDHSSSQPAPILVSPSSQNNSSSLQSHHKESSSLISPPLISPTSIKSDSDSHSSLASMPLSSSSPSDAEEDRASVRTTSSDISPVLSKCNILKDFESSSTRREEVKSGEFSSPSTGNEIFTPPSASSNPECGAYGLSMVPMPDYHPGNEAAVHMPLRRKEKTWLPCEVCGKKFDRPSLLKRHIRTHTGEKPHACDVCGKAFSTSSSLNTHRRIHSGEKPHECQVCGKRFTASSNLYYHRMTHKKEKPHKCTMCSKSFPTPGDLKSHMYVHNGSWPFKCDICNRGFSKQTNLKNHMLLHSGDKPHECHMCEKKFALQCNLRTHMKTHDDEPQEHCNKCGRNFLAGRQCVVRGMCRDCESQVVIKHPVARLATHPFSIESLVSGVHSPRDSPSDGHHHAAMHASSPATMAMNLAKAPYYASAMMHPMHHYGTGGGHYGVTWPPTPITQRFGI